MGSTTKDSDKTEEGPNIESLEAEKTLSSNIPENSGPGSVSTFQNQPTETNPPPSVTSSSPDTKDTAELNDSAAYSQTSGSSDEHKESNDQNNLKGTSDPTPNSSPSSDNTETKCPNSNLAEEVPKIDPIPLPNIPKPQTSEQPYIPPTYKTPDLDFKRQCSFGKDNMLGQASTVTVNHAIEAGVWCLVAGIAYFVALKFFE